MAERYVITFDSGRRYLVFRGSTSTCPVHRRDRFYWRPEHVQDDQELFCDGGATADEAEAGAAAYERAFQDVFAC